MAINRLQSRIVFLKIRIRNQYADRGLSAYQRVGVAGPYQTMATAVFGRANRAASCQFRDHTKSKGVLGSDVVLVLQRDYRSSSDYVGQASRPYQKTALLRR
jgi:hypothetical protein